MSGGWKRRIRTGAAVGAAAVVVSTMATAAASASRTVTVTFTGIGLGGQAVSIPSNQTALWSLASKNNTGPIYAGANGQYHVQPGAYLAGGYVPVSSGNYQNSVVIRQVNIRASETITLDSRGAKPFSVALTGVSATQQAQYADVCFGGGTGAGAWATGFLPSYVTPGGSQYVKPFADKSLTFLYHAVYTDGSGTTYDVAGAHAGGLPAVPAYTASAASLARLTVAARSGTVTGSQWGLSLSWQYRHTNCGADLTPDIQPKNLPGTATQYVSPGALQVDEFGLSPGPDFSYGQQVSAAAGGSYTTTFNNAVAGPNTGTPTIFNGLLCSLPDAIYGDPVAAGWAADATGTVTLHRGSTPLGKRGFGGVEACFRVNHRSGWYTMTEAAHHAKPPAGVTAATLSTSISVRWHFRIPALSYVQYINDVQLPATVTTFAPAGLSLSNQAVPGPTRIVLHVIRNGGYTADMALRYRLRSVRVEYSVNGGRTWVSVPVATRRGYWVVTVPSTGAAVSLRSIVTDVKGNSTVETVHDAYGVS
jgi:hypothetical protein